MKGRLLKPDEAAMRLGMKVGTIYAWVAARRIAFVKIRRALRIPESEIDRIVASGFVPAKQSPGEHRGA